jgi:hypothetical protein
MNKDIRQRLIDSSWDIHEKVETSYLQNPAKRGDNEWLEKQRLLLADMALHLLQTSLNPGNIALDKLRNNLHAIMTITDEFLPDANLKEATVNLHNER